LRLALDTNRYTDLCRGLPRIVELVRDAEAVFLPFVVVAELRAGFSLGKPSRSHTHRQLFLPSWNGPLPARASPRIMNVMREARWNAG
jgi:predicted nucleic acid-binding protein